MVTINTYSNFGNKPITITIDGTTPNDLILCKLDIDWGKNGVGDYIIDWKGSISFIGTPDLYTSFGTISFKSHKITINYGTDKMFVGYLLPEVYTVPNTGFNEVFQLNFESTLNTTSRLLYDKNIALYSIQDIFNDIQTNTDITNVIVKKSFSESLSTIMVYSDNFRNDDGKLENYFWILENICKTFGFKTFMSWTGELLITSCELLNGTDPYPLDGHLGINETYEISKKIDNVSLNVNNYALRGIDVNFDLVGSQQIGTNVNSRLRIAQNPTNPFWNNKRNYNNYERVLFEYQPGQTSWMFNKFDTSWNKLPQTPGPGGIYDENTYMVGGVPLAGAYPIQWATWPDNTNRTGDGELSHWWKLNHGRTQTPYNNAINSMMEIKHDNFMTEKNTYIFVNLEACYGLLTGDINNTNTSYRSNRGYRADDSDFLLPNGTPSTYSTMIDEGFIPISPNHDGFFSYYVYTWTGTWNRPIHSKRYLSFGIWMSVSIENNGVKKYWDQSSNDWYTTLYGDDYYNFIPLTKNGQGDEVVEFQWYNVHGGQDMKPILDSNGNIALFNEDIPSPVYIRFDENYGNLEIKLGMLDTQLYQSDGTDTPVGTGRYIQHIMLRNLNFQKILSSTSIADMNLAASDVIYTNMDSSNNQNSIVDKSDTFYIYSVNDFTGRGQLYVNDDDTKLDTLTYQSATEKPEYHFIRLATKWESKAQIFNDIIPIDGIKTSYVDRFFNGGEFNLIEGIANVQLIKCNQNIGGQI